ncbi:protein phosphatase 2C domain-containing protein [Hahella aquimaris]|uniref:protein phosphatase 2C domain-containing protein n=1 Tax=Hahella sp. HNIBRBA332 TaxID=3015983 RepID=UPI00273C1554|nr:protein phosphatase 2C domain-containing protein [Hahella sp. HNIBRBA332]WLQ16601.1 protein phosphatase 2C domain-containing protein [Hahella sp. HNIBRBA332]
MYNAIMDVFTRPNITHHLEAPSANGEDALFVCEKDGCIWFCIADGAGGLAGGREASRYVVDAFSRLLDEEELHSPDDFERHLRRWDRDIAAMSLTGETTAVIGKVVNGEVIGASVGDSQCWLFHPEFVYELTQLQGRKPLLGSGEAVPIGFGPMAFLGVLIVASDGFFNYAPLAQIKPLAYSNDATAPQFADLARNQSGALADDLSIIVIRQP